MSENATAAEAMAMPKHGELCWTEIATDNIETCKSFYTNVFGWEIKKSENENDGMEYLEFGIGAKEQGAMFQMNPEWYGGETPPPHISIYVAVDDVDASAGKAFDLGATIVTPPFDVPNVGKMCVIKDPTGGKISLITLNQQ